MKHYNDMNRKERREYVKFLKANNIWDGAMVVENLVRRGKLFVENSVM